jgi:Uma2 family endonuclease
MHTTIYEKLSLEQLVLRWRALQQDPDAPDHCELDEYGEIDVNPPPSFRHQQIVASIGRQLEAHLGGECGSYALATPIGVRFPNICWAKNFADLARAGQADPLTVMPPLCVEVISPGNRRKEIEAKVQAYLDAGVLEVLLIEQDGQLRWFTANGEQSQSVHGIMLEVPD